MKGKRRNGENERTVRCEIYWWIKEKERGDMRERKWSVTATIIGFKDINHRAEKSIIYRQGRRVIRDREELVVPSRSGVALR